MRKTRTCVKCASKRVVRIPGNVGTYGVGNNIHLGGFSVYSAARVTRYLCVECGFSEEWIDDFVARKKIEAKYRAPRPKKVVPKKSR